MRSGNERILLVDDNPSDVDLTKRALNKGGIATEMVVASDGQEALDYLMGTSGQAGAGSRELPALVLLDLKLPKVHGIDVLKRIREDARTRRLPVVILTTSNEEIDIAAAYDHGCNSYITKMINFTTFAAAIEEIGRYWLDLNEAPPKPRLE